VSSDHISRKCTAIAVHGGDTTLLLVATELKSDVLMLGSDVPGIFRGPPEPGQPPDVLPVVTRSTPLSFGAKSARGRGGMQAKVDAALTALERGVSAVVIFSGFEPLGVLRILKGEALGTLLLTDSKAKLEMSSSTTLNRLDRSFSPWTPLGKVSTICPKKIHPLH